MSAQNIFEDIDRVKQITEGNVEMLITMHAGLSEIAKCKTTSSGSEAMKYIAEKSLERVEKIAKKIANKKEVAYAQTA